MTKKPEASVPQINPAMDHFYPMPTVDYPFIIVDAAGKLWRLDPYNGTYREVVAE